MKAAQNETCVCVIFCSHTHILSHQKLSISLSGRRLVCHFLLPHCEQNQEVCERLQPRMQPESPLSLWKQEASCGPAPIQANPPPTPPLPSEPPGTCGSLFKDPDHEFWRPQTGSKKHESLKERTQHCKCRHLWHVANNYERIILRCSEFLWDVLVYWLFLWAVSGLTAPKLAQYL